MKRDFESIRRLLQEGIKHRIFPGGVCWIGSRRRLFFYESFGRLEYRLPAAPTTKDTIYDLASLTKPLVTAMMTMKLMNEGELKLDNRVEFFLPDFAGYTGPPITIRNLLSHTSGLAAWAPLYLLPESQRLSYLTSQVARHRRVCYSCLGYIVLGRIIEKITFEHLARQTRRLFAGIATKDTGYNPTAALRRCAPTERGDRYEKKKAINDPRFRRLARSWPWRRYLLRGEVHDGNAFYGGGGISGNAGLFATADDLVRICRAYLAGSIIPPGSVRQMIIDQTGGADPRGLGWKINIYPSVLSDRAFGHTGFTGTMLCYDPVWDLLIILLTNAVHPYPRPARMPRFRKKFVNAVVRVMRVRER